MVKEQSSKVNLAVDEALALVGPRTWTARLFRMGLGSAPARRYALIVLDEWHGPSAAASLARRSTDRLTFVQGAELHIIGRSPEGKLAIAAANIAGDIEQSKASTMSHGEIVHQVRTLVATASEVHALRVHAGQQVEAQLEALANQVKRLAALRAN